MPALNEAETIGGMIHALQAARLVRIRVVDNGSTDATASLARAAGAEVVIEPRRGYGQACWTGTRGLSREVDWILFCDADGSDRAEDVARLLAEAEKGADFVLGDRRSLPASRVALTSVQRFGNGLATTLVNWGWRHAYRDLGPLRLIQRDLYEQMRLRDRGFGWTLEMQVRAVELGATIVEIPVQYRPRLGGKSKISGTLRGSVKAGVVILTTLVRLWLRRGWPASRPPRGLRQRSN